MNWSRAQDLFDQALALPIPERQPFLDAACANDPDLKQLVRDLLEESDSSPSQFLNRVIHAAQPANQPMEGQRLGPYIVDQVIGQGGMGTVYLAQRADQEFEQQIALKVVRGGMLESERITRFRQERQILAHLEHPNIVRLLDGGTTADGLPYLAMEYVDGQPLTQYCDQQQLDTKSRCRLMLPICDAVAYAHRHLIIHRDLKPANILVTSEGTPKLLDFGIAKLVEANADETQLRPLTPDYASPEQLSGAPITTATDIYQLGAILKRLTGNNTAADLRNIIARSTHADPHQRYASAQELAEDLRRYLDNRPILARPDSLWYQTSKWVQRSPLIATSLALALIATIAATSLAIYQGQRAERRFEQVRKLATTFVFEFDNRIKDLPGSLAARNFVLDTAVQNLDNLAQEAGSDARLLTELAAAYTSASRVQADPSIPNLGKSDAAIANSEKAVRLARLALTIQPKDRDSLRALISALTTHALFLGSLRRQPVQAVAALEDARATAERLEALGNLTAGDESAIGSTYLRLGDLTFDEKPHEAIPLYEKSIRYLQSSATKSTDTATLLSSTAAELGLARVMRDLGDYEEAVRRYRRIVNTLEPLVARLPNNAGAQRQLRLVRLDLAGAYAQLDRFHLNRPAEAIAILRSMQTSILEDEAKARAADNFNQDALAMKAFLYDRLVLVYLLNQPDLARAEALSALATTAEMLRRDPKSTRTARLVENLESDLALAELRLQNPVAALKLLEPLVAKLAKVLEANPNDLAARNSTQRSRIKLSIAYAMNRQFPAALQALTANDQLTTETLQKYPKDLYFLRDRAEHLEAFGDFHAVQGDGTAAQAAYLQADETWSRWQSLAPKSTYPIRYQAALKRKLATPLKQAKIDPYLMR
jgi:serine/threonine protein kinase